MMMDQIQCNLNLPTRIQEEGLAPTTVSDNRSQARWKMSLASLLEVQRNKWHIVRMIDVSRSGLAFYHSEQLFPTERLQIVFKSQKILSLLNSGPNRYIEVVRCRYIQRNCFEVGACFVNARKNWFIHRFNKDHNPLKQPIRADDTPKG
jgi:hypothetical protein